jgi:phage terminase large subunit-like protein
VRYQLRGEPPLAHHQARRIALVGPTYHEAAAVMVEGVSGMLAVMGKAKPQFNKAARRLTFWNGAVAQLYSGEDPEDGATSSPNGAIPTKQSISSRSA